MSFVKIDKKILSRLSVWIYFVLGVLNKRAGPIPEERIPLEGISDYSSLIISMSFRQRKRYLPFLPKQSMNGSQVRR